MGHAGEATTRYGYVMRRKSRQRNPAVADVANAIEFWRLSLSTPVDALYQTPEELAADLREGRARLQLLADAERDDSQLRIAIGRANLDATAGIRFTIQVPPYMKPDVVDVARQKQRERLTWFSDRVLRTETLVCLSDAGANIAYVLSLLIRRMRRGAAAPRPLSVRMRGSVELSEAPVARFQAKRRLRIALPLRRGKPGPAETEITFAMALLADHVRRKTGRPHWGAVAELINEWALDHVRNVMTPDLVKRRVGKLQNNKEFRRVVRSERHHERAIRSAFQLFVRAKSLKSPP